MNFLVDANLPLGLAAWLRERGHQATHVIEAPGHQASDVAILDFASERGLVIVTKDEDFAAVGTLTPDRAPVVWLRLGNATNAALRQWLEPLLPDIVQRIQSGEKLIEVV
jgi:predicted nuclease of predicted toxin-antitoxin system